MQLQINQGHSKCCKSRLKSSCVFIFIYYFDGSQGNKTKQNQIKSNQTKPNQIKSNQIKSNQIKSNQCVYDYIYVVFTNCSLKS